MTARISGAISHGSVLGAQPEGLMRPRHAAISVEVQRRLWDMSERLTGTHLEGR
jgi:hypothetical protein